MEEVVESTSYVELGSGCCCLWSPLYRRLCLVSQLPSSVTGIVVLRPPDSMPLNLFESSLYACVRATAAMQLSFRLSGPRLVVTVWHCCLLPSGRGGTFPVRFLPPSTQGSSAAASSTPFPLFFFVFRITACRFVVAYMSHRSCGEVLFLCSLSFPVFSLVVSCV